MPRVIGSRRRALVLLACMAMVAAMGITGAGGGGLASPADAQEVSELGADIVFVIDDSRSMRADAGYVKSRVTEMVQDLTDAGIDPRFGLVEFAGSESIRSPLTDDLVAFGDALAVLSGNNGNPEAGFSGVVKGMSDEMGFRDEAGVCVVLVSDEDADVRTHSRQDAVDAMAVREATFFGIVALGAGTTEVDYGPDAGSLSAVTGGAVYSLQQFRDDPTAILADVTGACAQRVIEQQDTNAGPDQVVPEGSDVVLAGTVPMTGDGAVDGVWEQQLELDTYESTSDGAAGPVHTSRPLESGTAYEVVVSGNHNVWGTDSLCGAPDEMMYPSPGFSTTPRATHDAEFTYGGRSGCSGLPAHGVGMEFDTGSGFAHLEPVGGQPTEIAADHTYNYLVVGEGEPLGVRRPDNPLTDNRGMFRITVRTQESLAPWDFSWSVVAAQGPPIQLLGAETLAPTFHAVDDGTYRFRLTATNGDDVSFDEVVVTVDNVAPEIGVAAAPTTDDGLVMVSASITDAGVIDTHSADIDWGDGTTTSGLPAGAQGSGWAAVAGGHVYSTAGSHDVEVSIMDDDGGVTSTTTTIEVGGAGVPVPEAGVALWADDPAGPGITMAGNDATTIGLVHSNSSLRLNGVGQVLVGGTEYVTEVRDVAAPAVIDPPPVQVAVTQPPPVTFEFADYQPGGTAATEAGDDFHDMSAECGATWRPRNGLEPGLYWVPCDVDVTGRAFATGPVTIVAAGTIKLAGRDRDLQASFVDGLALATTSSADDAVKVQGSGTDIGGHVYAPNGGVTIAGQDHVVTCGVIAAHITVDGGDHRFDAGACGTRDDSGSLSDGVDVAAPPLLVPSLVGTATPAPDVLDPGGTSEVTVELSNEGATLVVTGLTAIANRSGGSVEVTAAAHELEVYDIALDAWQPLTTTLDEGQLTGAPVAADGVVSGPDGGIVGTTIEHEAAAAWAVTATVPLTADEVARIIDPSQVLAVRSRLDLDTSSDLRVRQTTRFGGNVVEALRAAGGTVTETEARLSSPAGVQESGPLGTLQPGATITWDAAGLTAPTLPESPDDDLSDAAYLAALRALDRATVVGLPRGSGQSDIGPVGTAIDPVEVPVDLPIVTVESTPLAATEPGTATSWEVTLSNVGSVVAQGIGLVVDAPGLNASVEDLPTELAPGGSVVVPVALDVPGQLGDTVVLRAEATWEDAAGPAYGPLGTNGSLRILLPSALDVDKWVDRDDVSLPFPQIPYVVMVRNTGDDELTDVVVVDDLEDGVSLVPGSVDLTAGTLTEDGEGGGPLVFDLGTIPARGEVFLRYHVDAGDLGPGDRTVVNQAVVTATGLPETVSDDSVLTGEGQPTTHVFSQAPNPIDDGGGGTGGGGNPDAPTIGEIAPADGAVVTQPTDLRLTATPQPGRAVESWTITTRRAGSPTSSGVVLASSATAGATDAPVEVAGTFDPTVRDNGIWIVRVVVTDDTGARSVRESSVVVDGDFKPGRFTTTFLDAEVGVGGFPLQVRRTYDSLRRDVVGDFGHGWDLEVAGPRVQVNTELGRGPWSAESCGGGLIFVDLCWTNGQQRFVTVTWPDGRTELFDFTPTGNTFFQIGIVAEYTPRPGSTSSLAPVGGDGTASLNTSDGHIHTGGFGDGPLYDPREFLLTDQFGTEYLLDVADGLRRMQDAAGRSLSVSDDGIASNYGVQVAFTRDTQGRVTALDGPADLAMDYAYDAAGDLVTLTDAMSRTTTLSYDQHLFVGAQGPAGQPLATMTWADGRLTSITDADGNTTELDVDVDDGTQTVTSPDGLLTTIQTWDDDGNLVVEREVFGGESLVHRYSHDDQGRRTRVVYPDLTESIAQYGDGEQVTRFVDRDGVVTDLAYNDLGLPSEVRVDGRVEQRNHYDDRGLLTRVEDAEGEAAAMAYNARGELTSMDNRSGTTTYAYDDRGLPTTITTASGSANFVHDAVGRPLEVRLPEGVTITYDYDAVGNIVGIGDGRGNEMVLTWDDLDQVTSLVDQDQQGQSFDYDAAGRVREHVNRQGQATTFDYDLAGRLTSRQNPDTTTTYTYDGLGRRLTAANETALMEFEWDANSNIVAETTTLLDGSTPPMRLDFDVSPSGRRTAITDGVGTTSIDYGPGGVPARFRDTEVGDFDVSIDELGRLQGLQRPNGVDTTYSYMDGGVDELATTAPGGGDLLTFDYDQVDGLVSQVNDDDGAHLFDYDDAGRLTAVDHPDGVGYQDEVYAWDEVGNATTWPGSASGQATHDPANRLTADQSTTYEYDLDGRLVSTTDLDTGVVTAFTWDVEGQLLRVVDDAGSDVRYSYDPLGRRIATTANGDTTVTSWDGGNPRVVMAEDGTVTQRNVHGLELGSVLATTEDGDTSYPLLDASGSVVGTADESGVLVDRQRYGAFGQPIDDTPTGPHGWHGMAPLADTGLNLTFGRAYDPDTGRFISEDPVLATNAYAYALANPVSLSDPTGYSVAVEYGTLNKENAQRSAAQACTQGSLVGTLFAEFATDFAFTLVAAQGLPSAPGLYGFIEQGPKRSGLYIGRSINLRERLLTHMRHSRPLPGSKGFYLRMLDTAVDNIDVAEQLLIDRCGGKGALANKINAVNSTRMGQLDEFQSILRSYLRRT